MDERIEKVLYDVDAGRYILEGKVPVPCPDLIVWAKWFENADNRRVRQQEVGGYWVSTVFLALDYSFGFGPPQLFETMIFHKGAGPVDHAPMYRAATWELALEQHEDAVRWAQEHLDA